MDLDWFRSFIAPALVSILVGVATGYITVRTTISIHTERIRQNSEQIERIKVQVEDSKDMNSQISDRLTRLETKIDLLLDDKLRVRTNDD